MYKTLKNGEVSEDAIHRMVMRWVTLFKLDKYIIHIPNEGKRTPAFGRRMKDYGLRKGVSDLFIAKACNGQHGLWLELKSEKGRLTPSQNEFFYDMRLAGYQCQMANSYDDAIMYISQYLGIDKETGRPNEN